MFYVSFNQTLIVFTSGTKLNTANCFLFHDHNSNSTMTHKDFLWITRAANFFAIQREARVHTAMHLVEINIATLNEIDLYK